MGHQQIAVTVHMWKSGWLHGAFDGQRRSAASPGAFERSETLGRIAEPPPGPGKDCVRCE
jgi:hypothetical protein